MEMQTLGSSPAELPSKQRPLSDSDLSDRPQKAPRPSSQRRDPSCGSDSCGTGERPLSQKPNPRKRQTESCHYELSDSAAPKYKKRRDIQPSAATDPVASWISSLGEEFDIMPQPPSSETPSSKRIRSGLDASEHSTASEFVTVTTLSRQAKYSLYQNPRYRALMEAKGSYMRDSANGPLSDEHELYQVLLTKEATLPNDPLLEPQLLSKLRSLLRDRSELRVCIDLHPRLVPSAEILALLHPGQFENLVEGHNNKWLQAIVFCEQLPQPDRTLAYPLLAFTEIERRKLGVVPGCASLFTACPGMLFPFFTAEVKCGRQALEIADRANVNSMSVVLRGVVNLYRQANMVAAVHRKTLGFSISHDDGCVRIYGHYPEIESEKTTYYSCTIREFFYADDNARERETSYRFFWNLCTQFAPNHLRRLKEVISHLRDPLNPSDTSRTPSNPPSDSQRRGASDQVFAKPLPRQRPNSRTVMQQLEQQRAEIMAQFGQQEKEAREREDRLRAELGKQSEQQQKEAREREVRLLAQLEQQEKEAREREARLLVQLEQQEKETREREARLLAQLEQQKENSQLLKLLASKMASDQESEKG